jgi:hypothetical protein
VAVFIPKARYAKYNGQWGYWVQSGNPPAPQFIPYYDNWPQFRDALTGILSPVWDITNQNWMVKLTPATSDSVGPILQSSLAQQFAPNVRTPSLGGLSPNSLRQINTH